MSLHVGQLVTRTPDTIQVWVDTPKPHLATRPMRGRVCYIHPKGRFHVVEFNTFGGAIRESFSGA